jgi:hypothetical protein
LTVALPEIAGSAFDTARAAAAMFVMSVVLVVALFEKAVASNARTVTGTRLAGHLNVAVLPLGVAWLVLAAVLTNLGLAPR